MRRTESLGDVARWMRRRTIDLIVIGLLAIASGVVGRELIAIYRRPPPPAEEELLSGTLAEDQPLDLAFGSAGFALARQVVSGSSDDANRALAGLLRRQVETALPARETPDADELALITRLHESRPFEEQPGYWALYGLGEDFRSQVGLRRFAPRTGETEPVWRIVVWGLSFPAGEGRWSVYAVAPAPGTETARTAPGEEVVPETAFPPLPPGAARTVRIVDRGGQFLLGFSGKGPVATWFDHFDRWYAAAGYRRTVAELDAARGLREYTPLRADVAPRATRIQIARDPDGVWRGLVIGQVAPSTNPSTTP